MSLDEPVIDLLFGEADFRGFVIDDGFVVGYGLDLAHRFRGLPYIGIIRRN